MVKGAAFLTGLFLIGVQFSNAQSSSAPKDSGWFIQPTQAPVESPFTLQLLNEAYGSCQTSFTHTSLSINGNSIYASFVVEKDSGRACPTETRPYGPSYSVPALPAGKYAVYASQQAACEYANPACDIVIAPSFVDTLWVGKDSGWFLQPKTTPANQSFTLQLLNYAYGNCQTSFTHTSLSNQNGALYASFVVENDSTRECVTDIRPYGPAYEAAALTVGSYPVYAVQHLACEYSSPFCPVAYPIPVFVDTLHVIPASALFRRFPSGSVTPSTLYPPEIVRGYFLNGRKAIIVPASR